MKVARGRHVWAGMSVYARDICAMRYQHDPPVSHGTYRLAVVRSEQPAKSPTHSLDRARLSKKRPKSTSSSLDFLR